VSIRLDLLANKSSGPALDKSFNSWAALLLLMFAVNLIDDYRQQQLQDMLWICHVSMLLLAAGLYWRRQAFIQVAALWIFPGFLFWFADGWFSGFTLTSTMSHLLAVTTAYLALKRVGIVPGFWRHALLYWLLLQQAARWVTAPIANVNIAHSVRAEASMVFDSYWQYWLFTCIAAAFGLWLLEKLLHKRLPVKVTVD